MTSDDFSSKMLKFIDGINIIIIRVVKVIFDHSCPLFAIPPLQIFNYGWGVCARISYDSATGLCLLHSTFLQPFLLRGAECIISIKHDFHSVFMRNFD